MQEEVKELQEKPNKKPTSKKKVIYEILLVLCITVVMLVILFSFNDFSTTMETLAKANWHELIWALLCLVLYFLLWPLSLCLIARSSHVKTTFFENYLIGSTEHFFNGITPFSTGGQPLQIFLYTKRKVPASNSTGMIVSNFIAFMIATNIFAIISLVYYGRFSANFNPSTSWMIILGFVGNLFTLTFMIMMATCKFIRDFFRKILEGLCKIKWLGKLLSKAIPVFDEYVNNAQSAAKEILSHKLSFIGAILLRGVDVMFYYAIPFFIIRSFDVNLVYTELPFIVLASSFAITTMVWVPTPGGTGGIEFAFTTIFTTFAGVTSTIALTGMILWRGLTYYLLMLLSFITYLIYEIICKEKNKKDKKVEEVRDNDDSCSADR